MLWMSQILFLFAQLRFFFHVNCTSKHSSLWDLVFLPNSDSVCLYFRWLGLATQIQLACLPLITELLIHSLTLLILNKSRPTCYFLEDIVLKYSSVGIFILCYPWPYMHIQWQACWGVGSFTRMLPLLHTFSRGWACYSNSCSF